MKNKDMKPADIATLQSKVDQLYVCREFEGDSTCLCLGNLSISNF